MALIAKFDRDIQAFLRRERFVTGRISFVGFLVAGISESFLLHLYNYSLTPSQHGRRSMDGDL